jgi:hypothetical protein
MKGVSAVVAALLVVWSAGEARALAGDDDDDDDDDDMAPLTGTGGKRKSDGFAPLDGPATGPVDDGADEDPDPDDLGAGHKGQFGLAMQFSVGMRGILPYNEEYCGERAENGEGTNFADFCFERSPIPIDLLFSYGLNANVELLLEMRFGLERDFGGTPSETSGPRPRMYAPGVKAYFSESGKSRLFSTLQVMFDTTGYTTPAGEEIGLDWGVRNVNGLQFDLQRAIGIYFFLGELVTWDRWLSVQVEAGLGIQGRFP